MTFVVLIFGQIQLACAQLNPFRELRDGDSRFITKSEDDASKRIIDTAVAIPVVRSYFENYVFARFSKKQFFEKIRAEEFYKTSLKHCQKRPRNLVQSCDEVVLKNLLIRMRQEKVIDDVVFLLLENQLEYPLELRRSKKHKDQYQKNKHYLGLDLVSLEQKYFFIGLKRAENNPATAEIEFPFNPMGTKEFNVKYGAYKKLTPRQRLYLNYSHEQIVKLAEIIKMASQVMNAKYVAVIIDEDGDGTADLPAIEASYSEKYKLAIKLIKRELNREKISGVLVGTAPTHTDLLVASMEAGFFTPEELKIMLDFPELRDPKKENWKKAGKIAWLIARTGILAIPGFGTIAAIPIVLVEAIIQGTKKDDAIDTTDDLF